MGGWLMGTLGLSVSDVQGHTCLPHLEAPANSLVCQLGIVSFVLWC